jgi:hypothetical protein
VRELIDDWAVTYELGRDTEGEIAVVALTVELALGRPLPEGGLGPDFAKIVSRVGRVARAARLLELRSSGRE